MACFSALTGRLCCSGPSRSRPQPLQAGACLRPGFVPYHHRHATQSSLNERKRPPSWSLLQLPFHAAGPRWACSPARLGGRWAVLAVFAPALHSLAMPWATRPLLASLSASCWAQSHLVLIPFAVISPVVKSVGGAQPPAHRLALLQNIVYFLVVGRWRVGGPQLSCDLPGQHPEPAIGGHPRWSWLDLGPDLGPAAHGPGLSGPSPPRRRSCSQSE